MKAKQWAIWATLAVGLLWSVVMWYLYGGESVWWGSPSEMPATFTSRQVVAEIWAASHITRANTFAAALFILWWLNAEKG